MRFTCALVAMIVCVMQAGVASSANAKAAKSAAAVTITGCLERDDNAYRLTETSGKQAPKARSWKTAFLKKRAADLEVIDASRKLRLQNHVGHRDALTGHMKDGQLHVASMRHLANSCGQ